MTITTYHWTKPADFASWRVDTRSGLIQALHSPPMPLADDCSEIVPSWSAHTPPGTAVEIQLRVRYGATWTKAYRMALWDSASCGSQRTSFDAQRDADGYVATDTLVVRAGADAVMVSVVYHAAGADEPQIQRMALVCSGATAAPEASDTGAPCCLETPCFSQFSYAAEDGWCSPTSLAMVLGYWYERTGSPALAPFSLPDAVPELVAPSVYDPCYGGYGNWSFNTAFAAHVGLESYVARMHNLAEIEPWLQRGVPVVMSVAWREGQLRGAPLPRSSGHLLVATGFSAQGDVLVADPAGATSAEVRRCYRRAELESCWLRPHGTIYLIAPKDWPRL